MQPSSLVLLHQRQKVCSVTLGCRRASWASPSASASFRVRMIYTRLSAGFCSLDALPRLAYAIHRRALSLAKIADVVRARRISCGARGAVRGALSGIGNGDRCDTLQAVHMGLHSYVCLAFAAAPVEPSLRAERSVVFCFRSKVWPSRNACTTFFSRSNTAGRRWSDHPGGSASRGSSRCARRC